MHDLTVAYKYNGVGQRPTEKDFLFGLFPKEVHIFIRKYEIDSIPDDRKSLEEWLHLTFLRKEGMLAQFDASGVLGDAASRAVPYADSYVTYAKCMIAVIASLIFFLFASAWFRWICAILVVILAASSRAFNGLDSVELALHGSMFRSEVKRRSSSTKAFANLLSEDSKVD